MDPITSVMRIMTDSVSNVKLVTLSAAVYRQARGRGDQEGMDRAAGHAAESMPSAIQASQASQQALVTAQAEVQAQEDLRWQRLREEAQVAARAQERARMRQALKKTREEAREEAREEDAPGEDGGGQVSGETASAQTDAGRSGPKKSESEVEPEQCADPAEKGVVYTNMGEIKPKTADKKLTVTA